MKKLFGYAVTGPFYLYFVGLFLAAPIFNWRYANDHGVVSWGFFGEIVATAKATIWPYYTIASWTSQTNPVIASSDLHYGNAKHACDAALKIVDVAGGIDAISPNQRLQIIELLTTVTEEGNQVADSYLETVHSELPKRYREEYLDSIARLTAGLRDADIANQTMAAIKYNDFSQWTSEHSKELHFPKR